MTMRRAIQLLGILLVSVSTLAEGQARPSGVQPGPIGVVLPSPSPRIGGGGPGHGRPIHGGRPVFRRFSALWSYPIVVESPYVAAVPVPVPYAVPYYVPLRIPSAALGTRATTPSVPYDPEKARITIIGSGADGGGGALQIEEIRGDTIRVTWRGTQRPIRRADVFLADSSRRAMQQRTVTVESAVARFGREGLARPAAFAGVTVVFGDGSTTTTLVPLPVRHD
jgi:hypothetical protein